MTDPATPAGPYVDLHAHTTASDGRVSPTELIAAAVAADLQAIAITDHDTLDGIAEGQAAGAAAGITVVPGIELSTIDGAKEVHLLGLHLASTDVLAQRLIAVQDARVDRAEAMVEKLNKLGLPVTMDMVRTEAGAGAVGRPHVARALLAGGWVRDIREAFDRYLGDGKPANVGKLRLELEEGIALIHQAGGVAVWAHPQGEGTRDKLTRYAAMGLDGVEVRHPSHNADDLARLATLCDFLGLLRSGGSDWHGAPDGYRSLGCMEVPAPWMDAQVERALLVRAGAA